MAESYTKLALLPGMDGTGDLFADFIHTLPKTFETRVVRYPRTRHLSYPQLLMLIQSATPPVEPFVLLAESASTPLAIQFAATNPPNLKALILCAGFATSPIRSWKRTLCSILAPALFRLPLPEFIVRRFLLGPNPSRPLLSGVRAAISSVSPSVLSARLRAILTCDARADLAQVTVPLLYLQAKHDRLVPESSLKEMRRIKLQMEVATIDGPHLLLQREPQQAAEIVKRFIRQVLSEE
jgi:pimeloyl-ACP methyl ester carboxylesterase